MSDSIRAFAPATVANVCCAFDILGFALTAPGDEIIVRKSSKPGVSITSITGDNGKLTMDPTRNTASVPVQQFLDHIKADSGVELELHKKMPLGSGLGSSAASSVVGVFAANELFGNPLTREELFPFVLAGEKIACGESSVHADNVAPALFGGFVLVRSYDPLDVIPLQAPKTLHCALVHPHIEIRTEDSRKILNERIELKDAVTQWGNIAGLVTGLLTSDLDLIGRSLVDVIIEPDRSVVIPGFKDVKQAALNAGALGSSISGSGPSMFALCGSMESASEVGESMKKQFLDIGINSEVFASPVNYDGPIILD